MKALKLWYTFLKIMGLCPLCVTKDGIIHFSYCGAFYSTILSLCYSICYFRVVINRVTYVQPNETLMSLIADNAAKTSQFCMIVTTWLCFGYRQNALANIYTSFRNIMETFKILKIHTVPVMNITSVKIQMVLLNCVWHALFVFNNLLMWGLDLFQHSVRIPFNFGRFVYLNFVILFIATMTVIRDHYRSLNNRIKELSKKDLLEVTIREKGHRKRSKFNKIESPVEFNPLIGYIHIHSKLSDLTMSIITFCSAPLYLTLMICLCELPSTVYDICLNMKDQKTWPLRTRGYFVILIMWLLFHTIGMVAIVAICDSTATEAKRTATIVNEILVFNPSKTFMHWVEILSLRLLQTPLTIELFGTLPMNFSVVYRIYNVTITYIIVMMQLDDQKDLQSAA